MRLPNETELIYTILAAAMWYSHNVIPSCNILYKKNTNIFILPWMTWNCNPAKKHAINKSVTFMFILICILL